MGIKDSLVAASALAHGSTVATRNTVDFRDANVTVTNPFGPSPPGLERNGGETIRAGYSHQSMSASGTHLRGWSGTVLRRKDRAAEGKNSEDGHSQVHDTGGAAMIGRALR